MITRMICVNSHFRHLCDAC